MGWPLACDKTTRLITAFANGTAQEAVSFLASMVMPHLLLQQPAPHATHRQRLDCLERRLKSWSDAGHFDDLLQEGRALQDELRRRRNIQQHRGHKDEEASLPKTFSRLMTNGKVKSALRLLSDDSRGEVLDLDARLSSDETSPTVRDILKSKHPASTPAAVDALLSENPPPFHPVRFEGLDAQAVRRAALRVQGSAGPSGLDAGSWRRMCSMFHSASQHLCSAIASATKRLCTTYVDPAVLQPFVACRLIPLSKNPGVRPIGVCVCEVLRRIIGKVAMTLLGPEIQSVAGTSQLCSGQRSGCEAAIHAMREVMNDDSVDGVRLAGGREERF